ncbi:Protein eyes shut [Eumeta japonica]|uniref:Protein eyes shut n=1 Tax=Eumeta variegata TaxID=151549 RepID=A0A4C1VHD0_EUMVA|nr:Protein eyes shut [Eumeta japonica]
MSGIGGRVWLVQITWLGLVTIRTASAGLACLSNPCHHGICLDDINATYSCYCVDGYTGVQCQTNWDECWSAPCQNGGVCVDGVASYNCSCPDGFIGDNCEINYNECNSNPCQNNGTCVDLTNGYVCSCLPGFVGAHCELDIAVCNSSEEIRCHNGGHCIEGPGFKFYCKCLTGWKGAKCEEAVDECESNPCQNGGVCIDIHADYMCACTFGYTGKSCEIKIEFCDKNSCSNNAICVVEDDTRVCYCVPDYHGERCELQYDECQLGPRCMNGGTCIDGVDTFTCSCPPRLTGALCECLILEDEELDCQYVSPTPLLTTTNDTSVTFIYDHSSTTESPSGTDFTVLTINKTTTPEGAYVTTSLDKESTTATETTITVVVEETTKGTTDATIVSVSGVTSRETESKITTETEVPSKITFDSENSMKETTTECRDTCREPSTVVTTKIPPPVDGVTATVITLLTTEKDKFITEATTPESEVEPRTAHENNASTALATLEVDTTTEKLFTDSPIGEVTSDLTTLPTFTTAEMLNVTTPYDTTIFPFTTTLPECSDSMCNNRGKCTNTAHGVRIMYVDMAKGVYMQLYMNGGLLKFQSSCGYQTMLLSELRTFVNKGFPMKIETRLDLDLKNQHCNATLRLNDTVAMSGGQVANVSALLHNITLYLSNAPNLKVPESKPFIGCIKDLSVNGQRRQIYGEATDASELSECSSLSCLSGPCLNGGTCKDYGTSYTCACANGWMGSQCEQSVCEHNPCQFGASCIRHVGSGFLCLCPYGKHGIFCEYNVEITRPSVAPIAGGISSYLTYPLSQAVSSERFDLRLRFQTTDIDQIALIAFIGQNGRHDSHSQHLAVTFVKGYIMLTWNMGTGARRIFTPRPLGERRAGHSLRVGRRGRAAWLSVDARFNISGNAPGAEHKMTVAPYLYIGGYPSHGFHDLPHDLPLHSGWRGCIWEVGGSSINGGKPTSGRGVGQCGVSQCTTLSCNAPRGVCINQPATYGIRTEVEIETDDGIAINIEVERLNKAILVQRVPPNRTPCDRAVTKCQGRCVITTTDPQCDCPYGKTGPNCDMELYPTDVLFTGVRSYVRLVPRLLSSVSLSLEAEVKPQKARGLVAFARTSHFYTALSLQGALLEFRWTDLLSGMTSLVRSGVVLTTQQWHRVKAGRYGSRLYVWVDGALNTEAMSAHAYPHTEANSSLLLGGAEDLSALPPDVMSGPPEPFTGCIRNLQINNVLLPLEKQNIQDGVNLGDCDGTACGGEACGGGVCVVEAGAARCSCAGGRCRRHAACTASDCAPPRGLCRSGRCVCYAGYAGVDCHERINITVPQFRGDSLLTLNRSPQGFSKQQLQIQRTPTYLTANFTTAAPRGLIMWMEMGEDYLGLGLENGFLKLVWSLHKQKNSYELQEDTTKSTGISRLVPHAGFLSDGEWHVVTLVMDNNLTLRVDNSVVYSEELDMKAWSEHDNVDIYFGGISNQNELARGLFHQFKGCIGDIATSEGEFLRNYTQLYSENVNSCQLFP